MLESPVVLLIYRRPDLTRQVVERIAAAQPRLLLVVADGPGTTEEDALCTAARAEVHRIRWRGDVLWDAAATNLGLRKRVSSGLDWAFSTVEEAIILEDDCLPEASFFSFCHDLLGHYRDDRRVMQIAGSSLTPHAPPDGASYWFSKYYHIWGWATWRRAWAHYDESMASWPEIRQADALPFDSWTERWFWRAVFDRLYRRELQTWDYQWLYAMWCNSGLSVVPCTNLVRNIGFGPGGTHYQADHRFAHVGTGHIDEIVHPRFMIRDAAADRVELRAAGRPLFRAARVEAGGVRHYVRSRLAGKTAV